MIANMSSGLSCAVTQMDNAIEQNAALVEQAAAAWLEDQAGAIDDAVAVFWLHESRQRQGDESLMQNCAASELSTA